MLKATEAARLSLITVFSHLSLAPGRDRLGPTPLLVSRSVGAPGLRHKIGMHYLVMPGNGSRSTLSTTLLVGRGLFTLLSLVLRQLRHPQSARKRAVGHTAPHHPSTPSEPPNLHSINDSLLRLRLLRPSANDVRARARARPRKSSTRLFYTIEKHTAHLSLCLSRRLADDDKCMCVGAVPRLGSKAKSLSLYLCVCMFFFLFFLPCRRHELYLFYSRAFASARRDAFVVRSRHERETACLLSTSTHPRRAENTQAHAVLFLFLMVVV